MREAELKARDIGAPDVSDDFYAIAVYGIPRGAVTDDPVADWMTYLWSYRRFALREPHLYGVMFGPGLAAFRLGDPVGYEAARSTFVSLLRRIHACVNAARWEVDDVTTAGEAVWSSVHGHTTLELTGFFGSVGRDPVRSYSEILTRMSIGPSRRRAAITSARA